MRNSENFRDAILLTFISLPQERPKAIFCTESESERETPNLRKDLAATRKTLKPKQSCPLAMDWLKPGTNPPK